MELNNEFRVAVPAAKTWEVLTDVERVAPVHPRRHSCCPSTATSSPARSRSRSARSRCPTRAMRRSRRRTRPRSAWCIKANGKETRGSGNAAALVTAQLKDEGDATNVVITTDLTISGKAAQFGRGVLADVSRQPDRAVRQEPRGRPARRRRSRQRPETPAPQANPQRQPRPTPATPSICSRLSRCRWPSALAPVARRARGRGRGRLPARPPEAQGAAHPAALMADDLQAALSRLVAMKAAAFAYHRPDTVKEAVRPARRVRRRREDPRRRPEPGAHARHAAHTFRQPRRHLADRRVGRTSTCATTKSASGRPPRTRSSGWTTRWPTRCHC